MSEQGEPIDIDDVDGQYSEEGEEGNVGGQAFLPQQLLPLLGTHLSVGPFIPMAQEDEDDEADRREEHDDDDLEPDDDDLAPDGVVQALGLLLAGSSNINLVDAGVGSSLHALLQQLNAAVLPTGMDAAGAGPAALAGAPSPMTSAQVIDALTGVPVAPNARVIQLFGNAFDAEQLADYLATSRDLRNPVTGDASTRDDLQALAAAVAPTNAGLAHRLLAVSSRDPLPASTATSRAQFFQDAAQLMAIHLLAMCELEAIDSLASVQATFATVWPSFVRAMCGLAKCDPLRAATTAVGIREMTSQAYAECIREDATTVVHEQAALQPVASSVFSLCSATVSGALFGANMEHVLTRMASTPALSMLQ